MKEMVFLGGMLVILLYVLGFMTQGNKTQEERPQQKLELRKADDEEWRIFNCKLVEQRGDTILVLHTMIRNHHGTD